MKMIIFVAAVVAIALPAFAAGRVQVSPPKWTILRQVCWKDNEGGGHCAIGLYGSFATKEACMGKNGGQLQTNARTTDGREVGQRCEMQLEGEF